LTEHAGSPGALDLTVSHPSFRIQLRCSGDTPPASSGSLKIEGLDNGTRTFECSWYGLDKVRVHALIVASDKEPLGLLCEVRRLLIESDRLRPDEARPLLLERRRLGEDCTESIFGAPVSLEQLVNLSFGRITRLRRRAEDRTESFGIETLHSHP
jgi:hypothetical protein